MTETLLLFAKADVPDVARWTLVDSQRQAVLQSGDGLPTPRPAANTLLVLHGTSVSNAVLPLPKRITSQVRRALPMLLEDMLATGGADIHAATGARTSEGVQVAAINLAYMSALMKQLTEAGHSIALAAPDYMLLAPTRPNCATLVDLGDHMIVALSGSKGGTIEKELAPHAMRGLLEQGVQAADTYGDIPTVPDTISATRHDALMPESLALQLAAAADGYPGPNLLQGSFSARRGMYLVWPHWRRTAALAALVMVCVAGYYLAQGITMNRLAEALDRATAAKMLATFPGVRNISHFRSKIRQLEARGADPFLRLSATLFAAVNAQGSTSLQDLRYDDIRKEMIATLNTRSAADAEAIRNAITGSSDIRVSQREIRPSAGGQTVTLALEVTP